MTLIVKGKNRELMTRDTFLEICRKYKSVLIDIGAGDAKGSLRYAKNNPDVLVIALDASFKAMESTSLQAGKKPERGGSSNLLCLYGNIKESFELLKNSADLIRIFLPWGDLLVGIAEISEEIVNAIATCGKSSCEFDFVINAEIWNSNLPKHLSHLGEVTPDFFMDNRDKFEKFGIKIVDSQFMSTQEIDMLDTTWSRKLMSSRDSANFIKAKGVRS